MGKPWMSSVKDTGELTVYNNLTSGAWVHVFKAALQAFNGLKLAVKLKESKDKQAAHVVMGVASGSAAFAYDGDTFTGQLDGKRLHGLTLLIARDGQLEKAAVFLPSDPQSSPRFKQGRTIVDRATPDMLKVIAVHELIHACGLENADHAQEGVFGFPLAPDGKGKLIVPQQGQSRRAMPPIFVAQATVGKVANLW